MFEELDKEVTNLNRQIDELRAQAQAKFKQLIKPELLSFMRSHPELYSMKFQVYTPYFNDGDPCVLRVNEPDVVFINLDAAAKYLSMNSYYVKSHTSTYLAFEPTRYIEKFFENEEQRRNKILEDNTFEEIEGEDYNEEDSPVCILETSSYSLVDGDLKNDLDLLYQILQDNDESLVAAFGDHVEIIVTQNNVHIYEYSHD